MVDERKHSQAWDIIKQQKKEKDSLKELLFFSLIVNVIRAMVIVIR